MPTLLPVDVRFDFHEDELTDGDNERFHLYLYYVTDAGKPGKYQHEWKISGSDIAAAAGHADGLRAERRTNAERFFRRAIEDALRSMGSRIELRAGEAREVRSS